MACRELEPLWLDGWHSPSWVQEQSGKSVVGDAESSVWKARGNHEVHQDFTAFLDLIKACGKQKDLHRGSRIHAHILKRGFLEKNDYVGPSLIRMYARCGALAKAQEVFDELPARSVAAWNALIAGYAQHGLGHEALIFYRRMQDEGLSPNAVTFVCLLKACGSIGAAKEGEEIHAEVSKQGLLEKNIVLGNALVDMYAKCGALAKAQAMFDHLPIRDVISWTTLIAGYTQQGLSDEALNCFKQMRDEGLSPDAATFVCILKACANIGAVEKGEEIHAEVGRQGLLKTHVVLGTALVDMYAKCGALAKAQKVFDELPVQNVVSWNVLIDGYARHGLGDEAMNCFGQMRDHGLSPSTATFVSILKACSSIGAAERGKEIHAEVSRQGLLKRNIVLGTALVDMYAKCGALAKAQEIFDELPERDVASWTALIAGYAQHGLDDEAVKCFGWMRDEGLSPDVITFVCILKACGSLGATEKGEEIHAEVSGQGLLKKSIVLSNALVDMYAKCGALSKAQEVFDELPSRDVASWNSLIAGYAQHGFGDEALNCFGQMHDEGFSADAITFVCILKACSSIGALEKGEEIHAEVDKHGLLEKHSVLGTTLVDMYAKCGVLSKAQEVFDKLPSRNVATWTVLIAGYAQQGLSDEALNCFGRMREEGFSPDEVTFVSILKACGSIGATENGEEIHTEVIRQGLLRKHVVLGTVLVDMYAKCGMITKAQKVFDELPAQNLVSWTVLMAGYAQLGKVKRVFNLFSKMTGECIGPNAVTFIVLLTTCSHAGLVEEGQMYFNLMSTVYCIVPTLEHLTCMVDLFSRAGQFDKVINMIEMVPPSDAFLLWLVLLGACQKRVNVALGRRVFERAVQLNEEYAALYASMSNIYAAAGIQEEANNFEDLR